MTNNEMVGEFHAAFENREPEHPVVPPLAEIMLRFRLMREEWEEMLAELGITPSEAGGYEYNSLHQINLAWFAKEMADLLYVVYGTGRMFGIDLDAVFAEVHRSNMSKLGADGKPIRREDGKFLKGPNYSPADIATVLETQYAEAVA